MRTSSGSRSCRSGLAIRPIGGRSATIVSGSSRLNAMCATPGILDRRARTAGSKLAPAVVRIYKSAPSTCPNHSSTAPRKLVTMVAIAIMSAVEATIPQSAVAASFGAPCRWRIASMAGTPFPGRRASGASRARANHGTPATPPASISAMPAKPNSGRPMTAGSRRMPQRPLSAARRPATRASVAADRGHRPHSSRPRQAQRARRAARAMRCQGTRPAVQARRNRMPRPAETRRGCRHRRNIPPQDRRPASEALTTPARSRPPVRRRRRQCRWQDPR